MEENKIDDSSIEEEGLNNEPEEATDTEAANPEAEILETNPDELSALKDSYNTLNDKYLRLYSEFENFRRRTAKEKLDLLQNAGSGVVKDLLPVLDDFDRAVAANANNEDPTLLREAFEIIQNKLTRILTQQGLKPMESQGTKFDSEYHEAITNIPAPTDDMKGKVVDVAEKGYFFNERIMRHAKVIVGQ